MNNRIRKAMRSTALAAVVMLTTATLAAGPAQAQPPNQGTWDNPPADFVDPDVCAYLGIVVSGTEWDSARWQVNFNADGSFKEGFVHHQLHVVVHANGKTMYEDDAWTELYRADGTFTQVGNWTHEQMDHGIIVKDSGLAQFDSDGNLVKLAGPHPTFFGGGMCPYFLPAA